MGFKKTIAGMTLAFGAMMAPLTAKSRAETNAAPKTVELSKAEKAQKLKEAIHLGLPREEFLKYVAFPEWIPVTKDGQYDEKLAEKMYKDSGMESPKNQKAFIDYVAAVEKGANPDIEFQKFAKQITGGDTEKMAALNKVKEAFQKTQERIQGKDLEEHYNFLFVITTVLLAAATTYVGSKMKDDAPTLGSMVQLLSAGMAFTAGLGAHSGPDWRALYQDTVRQAYNIHINQEIQKAANPKIVQMDMQQTKQFIEMAKQKGPVK